MAAREKYLSKSESAELAGVSIETIEKYIEYGLIDIDMMDQSGKQIRELDLISLFQVDRNTSLSRDPKVDESIPTQDKIILGDGPTVSKVTPLKKVKKKVSNPPLRNSQKIKLSSSASTEGRAEVDLKEINKLLKERIVHLREERDWLRKRVENLEVSIERGQTLQMSQIESVRKLLNPVNIPGVRSISKNILGWLPGNSKK